MNAPLHPTLDKVTQRITLRSAGPRAAYLQTVAQQRKTGPQRAGMGCANMAHTTAALPASDKLKIHAERAPHVGIVTAYNDMLSAHQPRWRAACRPCAMASPRGQRAWNSRCSRAT